MSKIQMYAIKHLPTGHFIPNPKGRGGRGGSHVEPLAVSGAFPPRLFHTESAAKVALSHWLKGAVTVSYYQDDWTGEGDETWHLEPKPHRKREDMAVVPVTLNLEVTP